MSAPKRFWKDVVVSPAEGGFTVMLDDRPIKTPAKTAFSVPTAALAEAVAEEWRGQSDKIDPRLMPQMRYANSVIDGIRPNRPTIVETVAAYGGTDLLCYRAEHPDVLIARQAARWDPLLDWARERYTAPLVQVQGVMYAEQPQPSLDRLAEAVATHDDFELAALHDLVSISGSLVIGLAVSEAHISAAEGFAISRLDEDWQIEQWGEDHDAAETAARKSQEFAEAARLMALVRDRD